MLVFLGSLHIKEVVSSSNTANIFAVEFGLVLASLGVDLVAGAIVRLHGCSLFISSLCGQNISGSGLTSLNGSFPSHVPNGFRCTAAGLILHGHVNERNSGPVVKNLSNNLDVGSNLGGLVGFVNILVKVPR